MARYQIALFNYAMTNEKHYEFLKEDSDAQEFHEFEQSICICFKDWITTLLKCSKLEWEIILVIVHLHFKH